MKADNTAKGIIARENDDPMVSLLKARESFMDAIVAMFKAMPLLGYNNPAKFLDNVLTRLNESNLREMMQDPDAPEEVRAIVQEALDEGLNPENNDTVLRKLAELVTSKMSDSPQASDNQKGYGTYL